MTSCGCFAMGNCGSITMACTIGREHGSPVVEMRQLACCGRHSVALALAAGLEQRVIAVAIDFGRTADSVNKDACGTPARFGVDMEQQLRAAACV